MKLNEKKKNQTQTPRKAIAIYKQKLIILNQSSELNYLKVRLMDEKGSEKLKKTAQAVKAVEHFVNDSNISSVRS